jgi:hypothetical protein
MDRKPVSDTDLARLGKFQGSIERNSNFRDQAFNHNLGRNVRVVQLLAYVGLLRRAGKPLKGAVDCVAAIEQNFSSPANMTNLGLPTGSMQAAHFLPGQIRVAGRMIWDFVQDPAMRGRIEFLFAEVEHLPTPFNQADTAAEAKGQAGGLCAALVKACRAMIDAPDAGAVGSPIPLAPLQNAFGQWTQGAAQAFRDAMVDKAAKGTLPPLVGNPYDGYTAESIAARSNPPASVWNRSEAVQVLTYYLEDQQKRNATWAATGCQSALADVARGFKP